MELSRLVREQWDRCLGWAAIVAGAVLLILGWFGVSGTGFTAAQIPYVVSGGLGGIILVAVGSVLLLSADLQDDWRKLDALESRLDRLLEVEDRDARIRALESRMGELAPYSADATTASAIARPSRRGAGKRNATATVISASESTGPGK